MAGNNRVNIGVDLDFKGKNLTEVQAEVQKILKMIDTNGLKMGLDQETVKKLKRDVTQLGNSITKNFNSATNNIKFDKVVKDLNSAGISVAALGAQLNVLGVNGNKAFGEMTRSAYTFESKVKKLDGLLGKMATTLANTAKWSISSAFLNAISGQIQQALYFTKDLDRSLTDIRIVSGQSADEMAKFAIEANKAAKALKTTTVEYSDAALVYFQQGMAAEDVLKMTEATVMGANIAGESTEEMSTLLTSVMNGYKLAADDVLSVTDKLAAVGADTAADFYELATGMSKVASMADVAGVNMDSLVAQLATIVSVTKEAPESIGTSLKTIYGRMLAFKNNATDMMKDEDGELFGVPSVESALEKYSLAVGKQISMFRELADGTKVMRNLGDVIEDIGDTWEQTDNIAIKFGLSTALAGSRQQNRLVALFEGWDMYKDAVTTSLEAEGTTLSQNEVYMESYAAHAKNLRASMEKLYQEIFDSGDMIGFVDTINKIVTGATQIVDVIGGLPGILAIVGAAVSKVAFAEGASKFAVGLSNVELQAKRATASVENLNARERAGALASQKALVQEIEYKEKLASINRVFKGESFDNIRKQTEEYLKQNQALEKLRAQIPLLTQSIDNYEKAGTKASYNVRMAMIKMSEAPNEKNVDKFKLSLLNLQNAFGDSLPPEVLAEFKRFEKQVIRNEDEVEDLTEELRLLIQTSADLTSQRNIGVDFGLDEATRQVQDLETSTTELRTNLDGSLPTYERMASRISAIRTGIVAAIPIFTSLGIVMREDASVAEKFSTVSMAIGTALLFNSDAIVNYIRGLLQTEVAQQALNASQGSYLTALNAALRARFLNTTATTASTTATVAETVARQASTLAQVRDTVVTKGAAIAKTIYTGVTQAATLATTLFSVALKALTGPIGWLIGGISLLVAGGVGLYKLFKSLNPSIKDLEESTKKASEAFNEAKDALSGLQTELQNVQDKIDELNGKKIEGEYVNEKELEKLRLLEQNLKNQIKLKEELVKVEAEELNKAATTEAKAKMNKNVGGAYKDGIYTQQTAKDEIQGLLELQKAQDDMNQKRIDSKTLEDQIAIETDANEKAKLTAQKRTIDAEIALYDERNKELLDYGGQISDLLDKFDVSNLEGEALTTYEELAKQLEQILRYGDEDQWFKDKLTSAIKESDTLKEKLNQVQKAGDLTTEDLKALGLSDVFDLENTEDAEKALEVVKDYIDIISTGVGGESAETVLNKAANDVVMLGQAFEQGEVDSQQYADKMLKNLEDVTKVTEKAQKKYQDLITERERLASEDATASQMESINRQIDEQQRLLDQAQSAQKESAIALQTALEGLNAKYDAGTISTEEYKEQASKILSIIQDLKREMPELANSLDAIVSKTLPEDSILTYLANSELKSQWTDTNNVIAGVTAEFDNLASVQEMVADSFRITTEEAAKLAQLYPELLENHTLMANGDIMLNEAVYKDFMASREGMLTGDIDTQIAQLEGRKATLAAQKAAAEAELQLAQAAAQGKIDITSEEIDIISNGRKNLTEYLLALGLDEVKANEAAAYAMAGNIEEFNRVTADVATEIDKNLTDSIKDAADNIQSNSANSSKSIIAIAQNASKAATQIANMSNGVVTDTTLVEPGGGGTGGAKFTSKVTAGDFKSMEYKGVTATPPTVDTWMSDLKLDIEGYTKGIAAIDAQISVLNSLRQRTKSRDYAKRDTGKKGGGGKGGGKDKELELDVYKEVNDLIEASSLKYEELNIKLQDVNLTDEQRLKILQEQNKLIDEQIGYEQRKAQIAEEQKKKYRKSLESQGAKFSEMGTILNYNALMEKMGAGDAADKFAKEADSYMEAMQITLESLGKISELTGEKIENLKLALDLDNQKLEKERANLDRQLALWQTTEKAIQGANVQFSILEDVMSITRKNIDNIQADIEAVMANKELAEATKKALLAEYQDRLIDEYQKYNSYLNEISQAYDKQASLIKSRNEYIDRSIKLLDITNSKSFNELTRLFNLQVKSMKDQTKVYEQQLNMLVAQAEEYGMTPALEEAIINIQNKLQDSMMSTIEMVQNQSKQLISQTVDELAKKLWGKTIEEYEKQMGKINAYYDKVLTNSEKLLWIDDMRSQINAELNSTNNLQYLQTIKDFEENELKHLYEKDKLSKYEVERAQLLYNLMLKEIALQNAQNRVVAKLRRDAEGNWTYQYLQDTTDILSARQDLSNALSELNKHDLESLRNTEKEKAQVLKDLESELIEALQQGKSQQEINKIMEEYKQKYATTLAEAAQMEKNAAANILETYRQMGTGMSDEETRLLAALNEEMKTDWPSLASVLAEMNQDGSKLVDDLSKKLGVSYKELQALLQQVFGNSSLTWANTLEKDGKIIDDFSGKILNSGINMENAWISATTKVTEATSKFVDEVNALVQRLKAMIDSASSQNTPNYGYGGGGSGGATATLPGGGNVSVTVVDGKTQDYLPVGSIVHTAGGDFMITGGKPGNYESIPVKGSSGGSSGGGGKNSSSSSNADKMGMSSSDKDKISSAQDKWQSAYEKGDQAGMDKAHAEAEKIRDKYGYSGGSSGDKIISKFKTGGYTGEWGSEGKLAILDEKELVLNADDTHNFLSAVEILRSMDITPLLKSNRMNTDILKGITQQNANEKDKETTIQQTVIVNADFSGVESASEIKTALGAISNQAIQYVYKKK